MRDWNDAPWVKLFTDKNGDWRAMPWEARTVLLLALKGEFDRAGFLDLGRKGPPALASILDLPPEVADVGLTYLLEEDGCWELKDRSGRTCIFWPNYYAAQNSRSSDRLRKQMQRERDRESAGAQLPAKSQDASRGVTRGHTSSRSPQISLPESIISPAGAGAYSAPEDKGKAQEIPKPRAHSMKEQGYDWAMSERARLTDTIDQRPAAATINTTLQPVIEALGVPGFRASWRLYLEDKGYPKTANPPWPWALYLKQWGRYRPPETPAPTPRAPGGFRDVGDGDPYAEEP